MAPAERERLDIVHTTAPAEELGLEDEALDIAYYADTLEITADLTTSSTRPREC